MEVKDYSKVYPKISNVLLYKKGWYNPNTGSLLGDLRVMLSMDGYSSNEKFITDQDIYNIIFRFYEEYMIFAIKNDIEFCNPLYGIVTGTYHNCYSDKPFVENMIREILAKLSWLPISQLKLPCPHYDKYTPKPNFWKPGMTYAYMNKYAQNIWNKNG